MCNLKKKCANSKRQESFTHCSHYFAEIKENPIVVFTHDHASPGLTVYWKPPHA